MTAVQVTVAVLVARMRLAEEQLAERADAQKALRAEGVECACVPAWAVRLAMLQRYGASASTAFASFKDADWARIWRRAAQDPDWGPAFEVMYTLEADEAPGARVLRRLAKWLGRTSSRRRRSGGAA